MELTRYEREGRANEHGAQAIALRGTGQPEAALEHADLGIALVEGLLAERPDDATTINVLAGQLYNRAAIQEQLGAPERGIPDARRSVELYQRLVDRGARDTVPLLADVQLRLARLLALAAGTDPETGDEAHDTAARGLTTYRSLARHDPPYERDLARAYFSFGEILRILAEATGDQVPLEVLLSYIKAMEIYGRLGDERTDEETHYYALTLLQTARLHRHPNADMVDMLVAARVAAEELWQLVASGQNRYDDCVEALHLFATLARAEGVPDWEQPLLAARHMLSMMRRPLSDGTAAIERDIERQLAEVDR